MTRRGDTLIEVMLAISIFAVVAMLSINMMNGGINTAQRTLEASMARYEIDAQTEALRFIHQSYVAERQMSSKESQFKTLWHKLVDGANKPSVLENVDTVNDGLGSFNVNNMNSCSQAYVNSQNDPKSSGHLYRYNSFVLNTRLVLPDMMKEYMGIKYSDLLNEVAVRNRVSTDKFASPSVYTRIIYAKDNSGKNTDNVDLNEGERIDDLYNRIFAAEGIWIDAVGNKNEDVAHSDYYDFYVTACWHSLGSKAPSTRTTVVRLYNPEAIE